MLRRSLLLITLLATAACAVEASSSAGAGDVAGDEDDLTASESAMIAFGASAQQRLYVRLGTNPSANLQKTLVEAAKRGVDVRAVLKPGSFDAAWMAQQHLESSGVDIDVRTDRVLKDVLVVADGAALVPRGSSTAQKDGPDADALAKAFTDLLAGTAARAGALQAAGKVSVHPMPESGRDRIVALFGAAKTSIDLEIYQLQDRAVVGALKDAAARHVKVRVMLEPKTVGAANYVPVSQELAAAGVDVTPTPPAFDKSHNVDHAKFAVIDGKELIFGTGNMVRSGLGGATETTYENRDFWVEDTRSANVAAASALFAADYARTATSAADFDAFVLTPDNANAKIEALVDGARHKLWVYNQSLDDDALVAKLIAAKERGADVRVLLGYQPGFGGAPPANQEPIDALKAAGIEATFLKKHYLHAKAIVADDAVYIGSQNFTNGGLRNNRELGEVLDDAAAVKTVSDTFESDAR